jgi:lipopolysaccharide assembly outer membrane protein LptD (OstA)
MQYYSKVLAQNRLIKSAQFPSILLAGVAIFLIAYFTLLSPSNLEEDFSTVRVVHPKDLLNFLKNESEPMLAKNIPTDTTPAYSLRNFDFFNTSENHPQLKFSAKKSNFYQKEQIIHAKDAVVTLSDNTVVDSHEALYDTLKNEIEFFGDVHVTFENGLKVRSNYMKAITKPVLNILIPTEEAVSGEKQESSNTFAFKSYGLNYSNSEFREVNLLSQVLVKISNNRTTQIQSDRARMNFKQNKLYFSMDEKRNFDRQFVQVHQLTMEMKSRTIEVSMKNSGIQSINALSDVSIRDKSFYSTSGKASFIEKTNQIELSDFPQVYQDSDTITGDLIIYNRTEDTIEVKESNAIYKR